jgi:hypothetical protein
MSDRRKLIHARRERLAGLAPEIVQACRSLEPSLQSALSTALLFSIDQLPDPLSEGRLGAPPPVEPTSDAKSNAPTAEAASSAASTATGQAPAGQAPAAPAEAGAAAAAITPPAPPAGNAALPPKGNASTNASTTAAGSGPSPTAPEAANRPSKAQQRRARKKATLLGKFGAYNREIPGAIASSQGNASGAGSAAFAPGAAVTDEPRRWNFGGCRVEVRNQDTLEAAAELAAEWPEQRALILDMASDFCAGGGWRSGASAQEEQLFYRTSLCLSLGAAEHSRHANRRAGAAAERAANSGKEADLLARALAKLDFSAPPPSPQHRATTPASTPASTPAPAPSPPRGATTPSPAAGDSPSSPPAVAPTAARTGSAAAGSAAKRSGAAAQTETMAKGSGAAEQTETAAKGSGAAPQTETAAKGSAAAAQTETVAKRSGAAAQTESAKGSGATARTETAAKGSGAASLSAGGKDAKMFERTAAGISAAVSREVRPLGRRDWKYPLGERELVYVPRAAVLRAAETEDFEWLRPKYRWFASFVAVAAIRSPKLSSDGQDFALREDRDLMRDKVRAIFRLAIEQGHRTLVLGALGCGAFRNPAVAVARLFGEALELYGPHLRAVRFAILDLRPHPASNFALFHDLISRVPSHSTLPIRGPVIQV